MLGGSGMLWEGTRIYLAWTWTGFDRPFRRTLHFLDSRSDARTLATPADLGMRDKRNRTRDHATNTCHATRPHCAVASWRRDSVSEIWCVTFD